MVDKVINLNAVLHPSAAEDNALRIYTYKFEDLNRKQDIVVPEEVKVLSWVDKLAWLEQYARDNNLYY